MSTTNARNSAPGPGRRTGVEVLAPQITASRQTVITFLDPLTYFYERLLPVETVEAIYADWHPDGLDVWLIVYHATEADREQIYHHERAFLQAFPGLGLDTRLIDRSEIDPIEAVDLAAADVFLRFPRPAYA